MVIRAAMVEFVLSQRGFAAELRGNPECVVERLCYLQPGARDRGTLYVAEGAVPLPAIPGDGGVAVISLTTCDSPIAALEAASDALHALDVWTAALDEALLQGVTLGDFLEIGKQLIAYPLAYFDCNLIVLASSTGYWHRRGLFDRGDSGLIIEGQMPPNRAADLVEDLDYLHAAQIHGGFYYEDANNHLYYGVNTFDHDEYLARLVIVLPIEVKRLHRGQEQLIDLFHVKLDDLYLRYSGNAGVASVQNDLLHTLARRVMLDGEAVGGDEASAILHPRGWSVDDEYVVAKLVFFEGVHWDSVSLYLCGLLERAIAGSCAFSVDREIVWFANLTRAARDGEGRDQIMRRFTESLVAVLRNYACKAGVSDVFTDFVQGHDFYREAGYSLDYGQIRDPHYWYFRFEDYAFDYLLGSSAGDLSASQTCHPALAALRAHDAENGTEYARTLICYLRNSQNTTRAADELYIHRTSFMRRMVQIKTIAPVDLEDPDQVLHLLLSAKLLGM